MGKKLPVVVAAKKIPPDERKRVQALFREFVDVGSSKLATSEAPKLLKEALKGAAPRAKEHTVRFLVVQLTEALPTKWPKGVIDCGGFTTWYFDVAWEELQNPTAEAALPASAAKPERKTSAKKAAKEPVPPEAEATAEAATTEPQQSAAPPPAEPAAPSPEPKVVSPVAAEAPSAAEAAPTADLPYAWQLGRGVHAAECRRLMQICARHEGGSGHGCVPQAQLTALVRAALRPIDDAQLAATLVTEVSKAVVPAWVGVSSEHGVVAVSAIVRVWFDRAWPSISSRMLDAHHQERQGLHVSG